MKTVAATEAKNRFGQLLESVHQGPLEIAKQGRAVAVMLSIADYRELQKQASTSPKQTSLEWLKQWRASTPSLSSSAMDEKDYRKHLETKHQ